ncbi:MAG TPA: hypothetical protein VK527_04295, partial [Candidatus Limnocylindrales bacterium]|nr:hypothetical protein [Candidatus Limnocylindrales bacterium]
MASIPGYRWFRGCALVAALMVVPGTAGAAARGAAAPGKAAPEKAVTGKAADADTSMTLRAGQSGTEFRSMTI